MNAADYQAQLDYEAAIRQRAADRGKQDAPPAPAPQPAPAPAPQAPPSSIPSDYVTFLRLPVGQRQALRTAHTAEIEALQAAHYARTGTQRPAQPEAAPVPHVEFEAFRSYREFLAAPRALRDAYRSAHSAVVELWESEFSSATRVKVGLR